MTLLLAKQCSDGVLLIADSVAIPEVGAVHCNAIKFIIGNRGGQACAVIFGGFAGAQNGIQSIDALRAAIDAQPGPLPAVIRDTMRARLRDESDHGDWKDDVTGLDDNVKRELFRQNMVMTALVSSHPGELWAVHVKAGQTLSFESVYPCFTAITQPGQNTAAYEELKRLCNNHVQTIPQALKSAAQVFDRATVLFPGECCYPAAVLRSTAAGVTQTNYLNFAELDAAGGA